MSDRQDSLRELYQEVIFDHNRKPRNYRPLPTASHHADGHNPLCGDQLTVYLQVEDGIVREASFVGHGCRSRTSRRCSVTSMHCSPAPRAPTPLRATSASCRCLPA
ncbi:MAG: iron-sulfur cluster assembly scaffold protein [Thauera sp.]|nr:iron-sulfur cluster assembly scaffold protein [Thauera sp.]